MHKISRRHRRQKRSFLPVTDAARDRLSDLVLLVLGLLLLLLVFNGPFL